MQKGYTNINMAKERKNTNDKTKETKYKVLVFQTF